MPAFFILWQLRNEKRTFDLKTRCGFWMLELNSEWMLKCICQRHKLRNLAFVEVHRKSPAGERIISGTLEVHEENQKFGLKKKFICLLEDGCLFTIIDFAYCREVAKPPPKLLSVSGEITISVSLEDSLDATELVHMTITDYSSLKKLSNDMENILLEKSSFADVTIKCGTVSLPAHKSILSASSPVFEAMFSSPMKEAIENEVVIEDIDVPALQAMLKYIYTGKTEDITSSLTSYLLFIANEYQIVGLKSACRKHLSRIIVMSGTRDEFLMGFEYFISTDLKNLGSLATMIEKDRVKLKLNNQSVVFLLVDFRCLVDFLKLKYGH